MDQLKEAIEYIFQRGMAATAAPEVIFADGMVPYYQTPTGPKACPELIHNDYAERPFRLKQTVKVNDPTSFIGYYKLFSDAQSRVFASETESTVTAVLDYHEAPATARWGQHKVSLALIKSPSWLIWNKYNNLHVTQAQFAEFLEQNALDIISPKPADIMEVASDLQATTEVELSSGVRANGQVSFRYTEETKATLGKGTLAVPERFTISVPVYVGGSNVTLDALLRFRVKEGKLEIWFTLVRPEEAARLAFMMGRDQIAQELGVEIINGQVG